VLSDVPPCSSTCSAELSCGALCIGEKQWVWFKRCDGNLRC
jgi:hypothetical protein